MDRHSGHRLWVSCCDRQVSSGLCFSESGRVPLCSLDRVEDVESGHAEIRRRGQTRDIHGWRNPASAQPESLCNHRAHVHTVPGCVERQPVRLGPVDHHRVYAEQPRRLFDLDFGWGHYRGFFQITGQRPEP